MAEGKLFTGIILEDNYLKVARIAVSRKKASLVKLEKVRLVTGLNRAVVQENAESAFSQDEEEDSLFGLDEAEGPAGEFKLELNLDDTDEDEEEDEAMDELDMAADAEGARSNNEMVLFETINAFAEKKLHFSLNIPAGDCIFQILKDADFSKIKQKDLQAIVNEHLESVYNREIPTDNYSHAVREDGALFLVSTDEAPRMLSMAESARSIYSGKMIIDQVVPDEVLLLGLVRANYKPAADSISAIVQYGETYCRILFMKGRELTIVSPIITEGSKSKKFLNTVFSKILFQLDTGEIPNLDRIILCNNTMGEESVNFLQERFPDVEITEFKFSKDLLDTGLFDSDRVAGFTTAIGAAWTSAGFQREDFPRINFLSSAVHDRQKVFKLQWHGVMLLLMIFVTPAIFNFYYMRNKAKVDELEDNLQLVKTQISSLQQVVELYNQTSEDLSAIQTRLVLLNELSSGGLEWSVNLDIVNRGFSNIGSIWLTSLTTNVQNKTIELEGLSLYKNRIPMLADVFSRAILQDVTRDEIREQELYSYRYIIREMVPDSTMYNTESTKNLKKILGGN